MFFPRALAHDVTLSELPTPTYLCPCSPRQSAEKHYQLGRDLLAAHQGFESQFLPKSWCGQGLKPCCTRGYKNAQ